VTGRVGQRISFMCGRKVTDMVIEIGEEQGMVISGARAGEGEALSQRAKRQTGYFCSPASALGLKTAGSDTGDLGYWCERRMVGDGQRKD